MTPVVIKIGGGLLGLSGALEAVCPAVCAMGRREPVPRCAISRRELEKCSSDAGGRCHAGGTINAFAP